MVASLLEYETVEAEESSPSSTAGRTIDVREAEVAAAPDGQSERSATDEANGPKSPRAFPPKISPEPRDVARASVLCGARCRVASRCGQCRGRVRVAANRHVPRGGTYVISPDSTVASAAIGLWFRAPVSGLRLCHTWHCRSRGDCRRGCAAGQWKVSFRAGA